MVLCGTGEYDRKMDRALLERRLDRSDLHVRLCTKHVRRQRLIVSILQHQGGDATDAIVLLNNMEALQALHVSYRNRLRDALELT